MKSGVAPEYAALLPGYTLFPVISMDGAGRARRIVWIG